MDHALCHNSRACATGNQNCKWFEEPALGHGLELWAVPAAAISDTLVFSTHGAASLPLLSLSWLTPGMHSQSLGCGWKHQAWSRHWIRHLQCSLPASPPPSFLGNRDVPSHTSRVRGTNRTRAARKSHGISAVGSLQLPKLFEIWQLQRMGLNPSFPWCPMGISLVLWGWIHPNPVLPIQLKNPLLCYFLYKIYLFIHKNKELPFPEYKETSG